MKRTDGELLAGLLAGLVLSHLIDVGTTRDLTKYEQVMLALAEDVVASFTKTRVEQRAFARNCADKLREAEIDESLLG